MQQWDDERQWLLDNGYDKIDYFHELQKAYYTKYIDAAGIAIVGPIHLRTKYLLDARDSIVVMTSKHPELRERLLSKHGKFYMVLIPHIYDLRQMPEYKLHATLLNDDPSDDFLPHGSCGTHFGLETPYKFGYCWAAVYHLEYSSARTFVHEFAHTLESEMERLQPDFEDKLKQHYEGKGPLPWYEYWARSVEVWFYGISPGEYEEFIEEYGVVGETLDYRFPRVSLKTDRVPIGLVRPDNLDEIREQAYTILEKHCFECHGENGTHKDVLLMDNQLELWDVGIISPNGADKSILFRRILGYPTYGPQMPLGKPPLSDEEIDIIEIWLTYFRGKLRFPSGNIFSF